jgi:hypothetical protein
MKGKEAIALLEGAQAKFADESLLAGWLIIARAVTVVNERQRTLARVLAESQSLREAGQQEEALTLLREDAEARGTGVRTSGSVRVLELELASKKADGELADYKEQAEKLIEAKAKLDATVLLEEALRQFPGEPALELLAAEARELPEPLASAATASGAEQWSTRSLPDATRTLMGPGVTSTSANVRIKFPPGRSCSSCGTQLPDNARYCDGCGKLVVSQA